MDASLHFVQTLGTLLSLLVGMRTSLDMRATGTSQRPQGQGRLRKIFRDNGLSIVMFGLFLVFWLGQSLTGLHAYNAEQREHGQSPISYGEYVRSGEFIESTFENWESEFLQMGAFVVFSAFLFQRGSGESKNPLGGNEVDKDPRKEARPDSPGPVHRGGLALKLYSHSLTLALFGLFLFSFALHAVGGVKLFNEEQLQHGQPTVSFWQYVSGSRFWFESFQNWQSEFLSVGVLVVLSIVLRQKGSPESKPVHAPHRETEEA
ncbi:DUF6766 family protein [Hyalangium gracile]|uniref:DUF6766 family protein n=1 Tax=Hyalangium gracile TaxID=394092 RepID=UPI001CCC59BA|nr:DUF6766 family protein [Hyalangium gracile]